MRYFFRYLFIVLCLGFVVDTTAQTDDSLPYPTFSDYNITITITGTPERVLYLQGYEGEHTYIADSAKVKSGVAVFKNKNNPIPCGIYSVVTRKDSVLLDLVLNKNTKFSVTTTQAELNTSRHFDGSEENATLFVFQTRFSRLDIPGTGNVHSLVREYTETAPQSFLSKYLEAAYGSIGLHTGDDYRLPTIGEQLEDAIAHTDFNEPRLLHCPLPIYPLLCRFLTEQNIYDSDSLQGVVDNVMGRCHNTTVKKFYLNYFFHLFDQHNPDFDPILVHLYDDFDKAWIAPEHLPWYQNKIQRIRKIIPGAQIPELISHDINGKAHSTNDIKEPYTILWFWDPDCDHCMVETPKLHQFYQDYGKQYRFEVFAVEVNQDYDRWKAFSDQHQLWDWINLSTSMGNANLDFFDYFDIMTTPVLLLIDNTQNHTIIARQITLDELNTYFKNHYHN